MNVPELQKIIIKAIEDDNKLLTYELRGDDTRGNIKNRICLFIEVQKLLDYYVALKETKIALIDKHVGFDNPEWRKSMELLNEYDAMNKQILQTPEDITLFNKVMEDMDSHFSQDLIDRLERFAEDRKARDKQD